MKDLRIKKVPFRLAHVAERVGLSKLDIEPGPQWIYVVRCEGFVKIGIAAKPESRLKDMQVGNPFPLKLVLKLRSDNARRDERALHHTLRPHWERGEWFRVSDAFDQLLATWKIAAVNLKP